jgi:hypothetical protein
MLNDESATDDLPVAAVLHPDETLAAKARARDAAIAVTDRRLLVSANDRLALDVPLDGLRRVQFDIERSRPATMVIVPEQARYEPQVLAIDPEDYDSIARVLVIVGRRLAETQ